MYPHIVNSGRVIDEAMEFDRVTYRLDCAQIITSGGRDIGLWKVVRDSNPWELCQIQILPENQGAGIGAALIATFLQEARDADVSVTLVVLKNSPASRLYERLGFRIDSAKEFVYEMRWNARM